MILGSSTADQGLPDFQATRPFKLPWAREMRHNRSMPDATERTSTGLTPNLAATIAAVFPIVGGIVMLLLEKQNRFVRFYAVQSLVLSAVWIGLNIFLRLCSAIFHILPIIGGILSAVTNLVLLVAGLGFLVFWVIQIIKAFNGVEWEIPYIGPVARAQLAKMDVATAPASAETATSSAAPTDSVTPPPFDETPGESPAEPKL